MSVFGVGTCTWKVVPVLPTGSNDLHRVWKGTRTFGVICRNFTQLDINAPWRTFPVTVDQIERLNGYDFFDQVPKLTQQLIEQRRDLQ